MRRLEIRRHAYTKKGAGRGKGSHLSSEGVRQAREIGQALGPFDLVLTSSIPRTLESALAMGFAVDEQWDVLGDIPADVWEEIGHHERWAWEQPFVEFARLAATGGATARLGQRQKEAWRTALEAVPANGAVLVVSHGRIMEAGLVTCFPDSDFPAWGTPFQHGEGVEFGYEDGRFTELHWRRNGA
ncbi:MAG: histidine phosphatase family protein [Ardenticatenales bacterium]|nr:histidine phosphatase family protein [Ardenticatenales bacterium]